VRCSIIGKGLRGGRAVRRKRWVTGARRRGSTNGVRGTGGGAGAPAKPGRGGGSGPGAGNRWERTRKEERAKKPNMVRLEQDPTRP